MTSDSSAAMKGAGMRSLIWKELRENYRWALLGFIGMCVAMGVALDPDFRGLRIFSRNLLSVASEEFQGVTAIGCAIIGIALGILQVAFESRGDRFSLLVHRPVTRSVIFAGKCLAGAVLYLFATAVPFLLASWWAAGHTAAPFAGSMMLPGVVDITLGFAYYFAGVLTALREARWYASRGIGIVAASVCSCVAIVVGPFWLAMVVAIAGVAVLATAAWGSFVTGGEGGSQPLPARAALAGILVIGLGSLVTLASFGIYEAARELRITSYRFVERRFPGEHRHRFGEPGKRVHFLGLRPVSRREYWPPIPRYRFEPRFVTLSRTMSGAFSTHNWFFDRDEGVILRYDRILRYDQVRDQVRDGEASFAGYIDPSTGTLESERPGRALTYQGRSYRTGRITWTHSRFGSRLAVFSDVVFDFDASSARPFYTAAGDDRIIAAVVLEEDDGVPPFAYAVIATHKSVLVLDRDGRELLRTDMLPGWERYDSIGVARLDDDGRNERFAVYFTAGELHRREIPPAPEEVIRFVSAEGDVLEEHRVEPKLNRWVSQPLTSDFAGPWMPIAAMALAGLEGRARLDFWHSVVLERWYVYLGLAFLGAGCALAITRRYSFSRERVALWTVLSFVLGLVGLFTLLCLEAWPAREPCAECGRRRLVTRRACEHCGAEWPAPQPDGTEIFEPAR